jgi:hypothetical protein
MNDIAKRNGTDIATTNKNPFEQYSEAAESNRIVGDLLKFVKGDWTAGRDSEEIPEGTELIAIMDEMLVGWLKWEDSKPADMRLGKVSDGFMPSRRAELGDDDKDRWELRDGVPRDPWQLTNVLILKGVETDRLFTFTTSSKGGIGALAKLAGAFGKHMRQRPDEFPVVALGASSYKHPDKSRGKIDFPVFEVLGWVDKGPSLAALAGEIAAEKHEVVDDEPPFDPDPPKPIASGYKDKAAAGKVTVKPRF